MGRPWPMREEGQMGLGVNLAQGKERKEGESESWAGRGRATWREEGGGERAGPRDFGLLSLLFSSFLFLSNTQTIQTQLFEFK
jgi:hypothetical protein